MLVVRTSGREQSAALQGGIDMGSGNHLFDPNSGIQAPRHWVRRDFVKGVAALAGAAGLSAYDMRSAAAEPPPETTRLRIHENELTCLAPQIIAQELLHTEGFTDVRYIRYLRESADPWCPSLPQQGKVRDSLRGRS
jgi:hypothetical protein